MEFQWADAGLDILKTNTPAWSAPLPSFNATEPAVDDADAGPHASLTFAYTADSERRTYPLTTTYADDLVHLRGDRKLLCQTGKARGDFAFFHPSVDERDLLSIESVMFRCHAARTFMVNVALW